MNPALSVLVFTVSSGAGYGLLIWLIIFQLATGEDPAGSTFFANAAIGLVLVTVGLLSSTLHLANPKNAWRAFSRFRTSWLSREGVFAVLFYPVFLLYLAAYWWQPITANFLRLSSAVLALMIAILTLICTGMIYASLKPIRQWHNPLTTPIYLGFSLMTGGVLFCVLQLSQVGAVSTGLIIAALIALVVTAGLKFLYFRVIGQPDGVGIATATGFSQAGVRLLDAGHSGDTFLTREFMFTVDANRLLQLRRWMWALTFFAPIVLMVLGTSLRLDLCFYLALPVMLGGTLLERWLFFAEARHVVRLYHGDQTA